MIAIGAGYSFGLLDDESKLNGISVEQRGSVEIDGTTFPLFKGKTFEDSRQIDSLLDGLQEYDIKTGKPREEV